MLNFLPLNAKKIAMNIYVKSDSVADQIRALVQQHGISAERTKLDVWCDNVTRLAGDDVKLDDMEQMTVALGRTGAITPQQAADFHVAYLKETGRFS